MNDMDWEDMAEWLQAKGFSLVVEALGSSGNNGDDKWAAYVWMDQNKQGTRYGVTIPDVVTLVYVWVKKQFDQGDFIQ